MWSLLVNPFAGASGIPIAILAALIAAGGIWFAGDRHGVNQRDLSCKAEIADIHDKWAVAQAEAVKDRDSSRARADNLARQLEVTQDKVSSLQKRLSDEIRNRASATRRALDGQLVGMLNNLSPIRESVTPIHETGASSSGTAPQTPAPPSNPTGFASERSVAVALAEARGAYEDCRTQVDKLVDWAVSVTK